MSNTSPKTLAVIGNNYQQGHTRLLQRLLQLLHLNGFSLQVHQDFFNYLKKCGVSFPTDTCSVTDLPGDAIAVLSVGGDGTFLHAAQWVKDSGIPVVGINTGHLGYLAHFSIDDMDALVAALKNNTLICETRTLLRLDILDAEQLNLESPQYALNEISILKDDTSSMISIHTAINKRFLAEYRADGLIIATPTGSTGYNMSAGGPLLQPGMDAIALTPIAPHSLTQRPLVVAGESCVHASTSSRSQNYRVAVDGNSFTLPSGTAIEIKRAPFSLNILTQREGDFAATLRSKLNWAAL